MEMGRSLSFTIDNGVARSADGSLLWILHPPPPSGQRHLQQEHLEAEEAEFLDDDDTSDDDYDYEYNNLNIDEFLDNDDSDMDEEVTLTMMDHLGVMTSGDRQAGAHRRAGGEERAVFVPASDAAVAGLEKHAFHATAEGRGAAAAITACAICLENFEDGEEVTVMPCSRGHEFHPDCITKWLGKGNTCPLCRHALPTQTS